MATPASRFTTCTAPDNPQQDLPLRLPPSLAALPASTAQPALPPGAVTGGEPDAVETDRVVPASGNMFAAGRRIWPGKASAGQQVTLRLDRGSNSGGPVRNFFWQSVESGASRSYVR